MQTIFPRLLLDQAQALRENGKVKEFGLGMGGAADCGPRKRFKAVKFDKRRQC